MAAQDRRWVSGSAKPDHCLTGARFHCADSQFLCMLCYRSDIDCRRRNIWIVAEILGAFRYCSERRDASEMLELTLICSGWFWNIRDVSECSRSLGIAEHISEMTDWVVSRVFGISQKCADCRPRDLSCVRKRFPYVAGLRKQKVFKNLLETNNL